MKPQLWIACVLLAGSALVAQTNTGTIEGSLVRFGTTAPIRNADVVAMLVGKPGKGQPKEIRSRTDQYGHFSLENLGPGRYTIRSYFEGSDGSEASWITLLRGQHIRDVALSLALEGTIRGRILQPDGGAARGLRVELFKPTYRYGERFLEIARTAETDAQGEYQSRVSPGEYFVRTRPRAEDNTLIYFPGTAELGRAMPIEVPQGVDVRADIRLSSEPVFKISGGIIGNPTDRGESRISTIYLIDRNATVRELVYLPTGCTCPPERSELEPARFVALSSNRFEIRGVRPGSYEVVAELLVATMKPGMLIPVGDALVLGDSTKSYASYEGRTSVEVQASDVSDVKIDVGRRADIEGRMISSGKAPSPKDSLIYLFDRSGRSLYSVQADRKGRFSFHNVPDGDYRLSFRSLPQDSYVVDVRQGGLSIYDTGLKVNKGSRTEPIEVLTNPAGGAINGSVQNGGTATFAVVLVPAAPRKSSALIPVASATHDDFKFEFRGVPPGDYRVVAVDTAAVHATYTELTSEDFLARHELQGVPVTVQPGGRVTVQAWPMGK